MSHNYGLLTDTDVQELERSLSLAVQTFPGRALRLLEVGLHQGKTARGVKAFLDARSVPVDYWGVDCGVECREAPFPGARVVWGDSMYVHWHTPGDLHWLLIDGCHCRNHVILDFWNFATKLVPGGLVLLHDATPRMPAFTTYMSHGPQDQPGSYVSTRKALELMNFLPTPPPGWRLVGDAYDPNEFWGGFVVFQRERTDG